MSGVVKPWHLLVVLCVLAVFAAVVVGTVLIVRATQRRK
jgi:hypothetical protein